MIRTSEVLAYIPLVSLLAMFAVRVQRTRLSGIGISSSS